MTPSVDKPRGPVPKFQCGCGLYWFLTYRGWVGPARLVSRRVFPRKPVAEDPV